MVPLRCWPGVVGVMLGQHHPHWANILPTLLIICYGDCYFLFKFYQPFKYCFFMYGSKGIFGDVISEWSDRRWVAAIYCEIIPRCESITPMIIA